MKKRVRLGTVFFLIVATAIITAIGTYYYMSNIVSDLSKNRQMYQKLETVNQIITRSYINSIDPVNGYDDILDGIVGGYINKLGDPYSYYLNEKNFKGNLSVDGSYVGIGIKYSFDTGTGGIKVDYCQGQSPAELAGICNNDVIIAIDDVYVTEDGYKKAVQKLFGEEGSVVTLSIVRADTASILDIDVTRRDFVPQTINYKLVSNSIGYIYIKEFVSNTTSDFMFAVDDLKSKGAKSLIIDVRFTFSGELEDTVKLLDEILPAGIIVSLREKNSSELQHYFSDDKHLDIPTIVIQNSQTSGVAEIFSSSLRDNGYAEIVGNVSKGIGTGQRDIALSDGSAIRLSAFEYVTPAGERFNGNGVSPNYFCILNEEKEAAFSTLTDEEDDQLQFAIEKIKGQ